MTALPPGGALQGHLMTDIVAQARQAREKLAVALSLLQNPEAGNLIDSVAEPVAKAMGALHQVESSKGAKLTESAPAALVAVRNALAALQSQPETPISEQALEHIAGSLGLVHGLAEQAKQPSAEAPHAPEPQARESEPRPAARDGGLDKTQMAPQQSDASRKPAPAAPGGALDATLPTQARKDDYIQPRTFGSTQPSVRPEASIASATQESAKGPQVAAAVKTSEPAKANRNSKMAPPPPGGKPDGALEVEANLGAHSPTNFYKGLSGNDVIDDGGLFVATYEIPAIGTKLYISVNMPGGYQFDAVAEVRWTRETGAGDAPPGYGCAFKNLTEEARKLVYRYVRNREPLFHDDL
jgi:hypothetical protein